MHPVLLAFAVPAGGVLLFFAIAPLVARRLDGPNAPIVVVDRLASDRLRQALATGWAAATQSARADHAAR
ncbi:hypothetical protein EDD30_2197 [Couchioplanes caeruleus]|uniref:Uncharacterized protein n=1 Tax=Couchioplanes caeruleus TaxID=56438 RepID=A0A3N1GGN9_9ACTN|nr:hypothetical protein EDD30_2197 [Couchioplanes caeruleus]